MTVHLRGCEKETASRSSNFLLKINFACGSPFLFLYSQEILSFRIRAYPEPSEGYTDEESYECNCKFFEKNEDVF
jgi:hypothetical protein